MNFDECKHYFYNHRKKLHSCHHCSGAHDKYSYEYNNGSCECLMFKGESCGMFELLFESEYFELVHNKSKFNMIIG